MLNPYAAYLIGKERQADLQKEAEIERLYQEHKPKSATKARPRLVAVLASVVTLALASIIIF
ncbi:MAG: hypothetical protein GTO18_14545 [Anaerolineales bacterium]|nr:hypothetical protein [Anaerolineales bacterium]